MFDHTRRMSHVSLVSGLLAAVVTLALCDAAWANAFRNPPPTAASLATDGGKVAVLHDASAVSINPANLIGARRELLLSVNFIDGNTDITSPMGRASTETPVVVIPNIFYAQPVSESISAGIGITTPYGQGVEWNRNEVPPYESEMRMVDVTPAVALKLGDTLSVGVGVDIYWSDLTLKNADPIGGGTVKLEGDGFGVGAHAGVTLQVTESQSLAATYSLPFSIEYEGDTTLGPLPGIPSSDFDTEIDFPWMVTVGYGIQVTDDITLGADVEWVGFSENSALPMDYGMYNTVPDFAAQRTVPQNWDDIWTFGAAGTWGFMDNCALRGSYKFLESPIPDETLAPTLPDADKHILAVGLGWRNETHRVDVTYAYSIFDDRDVAMMDVPGVMLEYELDSQIFGVNYGCSF